jgi:hypothetical protein
MRDLAEVYQYGGHQTSLPGVTDRWKNNDKAAAINKDLNEVLIVLWNYITEAVKEKQQ